MDLEYTDENPLVEPAIRPAKDSVSGKLREEDEKDWNIQDF